MLKNVCVYKEFSEEHLSEHLQLTESNWEEINLLLSALEPIFIATQKLQREQLFFGDFYKLWLETKLSVKSMENTHSKDLAKCLEKREVNLTQNEVVLSAIYLDPRIRRVLIKNPIQQVYAKNHLTALMRKILSVNKKVILYFKNIKTIISNGICILFHFVRTAHQKSKWCYHKWQLSPRLRLTEHLKAHAPFLTSFLTLLKCVLANQMTTTILN